jgi:hypothetical protein
MAYYEIAARYTKLIPIDVICYVVSCLVSTQGLRHSDLQLRSRSAYLLLKITESLGPEAGCLLQCVGSFTGNIAIYAYIFKYLYVCIFMYL